MKQVRSASAAAVAGEARHMKIVELTDAIEIRRCKRAMYCGRVVTFAHDDATVSGLVRAIRPNPRGDGVLATIMPKPVVDRAAER